MKKVIIIGGGNAALCAGIAALENNSSVIILEAAPIENSGGNSMYTAGAMRFVYNGREDLIPLLDNPKDEKLNNTEFGSYLKEIFESDLLKFNDGKPLSLHQKILIDKSYETINWLSSHNIKFEPIYSRQTFEKDGKHVFWGGLTLESKGEGVGLVEAEKNEFLRLGGKIIYECKAQELISKGGKVAGVKCTLNGETVDMYGDAVVIACGGFEANAALREKIMGGKWALAKVRGTPYNMGKGIEMALSLGAAFNGLEDGCHATPMDKNMPEYGNLSIPHIERKHYRKICYFLGVMLNANGERFVNEGLNFRNYTYAQFGSAILNQPGNVAWQIFDSKVDDLLYEEYRFWDASFEQADSLEDLLQKLEGIDKNQALNTLIEYNQSVNTIIPFDPTILDGKSTKGLIINKTNWANMLDTPPFKAYPVTCGITFTYGGIKVDENAAVLHENGKPIEGLFACGELIGGVFYNGYPGGSGLTSGSVFGRIAGHSASQH